jgi:hypothetical protein
MAIHFQPVPPANPLTARNVALDVAVIREQLEALAQLGRSDTIAADPEEARRRLAAVRAWAGRGIKELEAA